MDLLDSLNILIRRWMLTVPLLLLTIGGVVAGYVVLPWSYQAQSTVVFLASPFQAKQAGGNPWLLFDSSLTVTAEVVGREVMGDDVAAQMKARNLTSAYEVMIAPDSVGPVLSIDVTGAEEADVRTTLETLTQVVVTSLEKIQADDGVTERARITASVVTTMPPTRQSEDKLRTLVMALFAGMVMTIVTPLFVDAVGARRRRGGDPADPSADPLAPVHDERPLPVAQARPAAPRRSRSGRPERQDGQRPSRRRAEPADSVRDEFDREPDEEPSRPSRPARAGKPAPRTDPANGSWSSSGTSGRPVPGRDEDPDARETREEREVGSDDDGDPDYLAYYLSPPVPPGTPPAERDA